MKASARPRTPFALSDSLHQQLSTYALAASAAGVGMLALAHPADAKIIYTPTHKHITLGHPVSLDLNQIGVVDFVISVSRFITVSGSETSLGVIGVKQENSLAGHYYTNSSLTFMRASALKAGRRIGPNLVFIRGRTATSVRSDALMVGEVHGTCFGSWDNAKRRYLGFKFRVNNGPTQYGWARLNASCSGQIGPNALLTGYAYETTPNKPIIAGKTKGPDVITVRSASLGQLACGSAAAR